MSDVSRETPDLDEDKMIHLMDEDRDEGLGGVLVKRK